MLRFDQDKFRKAMERADLGPTTLAREMVRRGSIISREVICKWLSGDTQAPSSPHLRLACDILKVNEDELFVEDGQLAEK